MDNLIAELRADELPGEGQAHYEARCQLWKLLQRAADHIEMMELALNKMAQWHDGEVGPHMDEPCSAAISRAALKGEYHG